MNCQHAMRLIHLERDDRLTPDDRRALESHLEACADCRSARTALAEAAEAWRVATGSIEPPDATSEWAKIRRAMREAEAAVPGDSFRRPWWQPATALVGAVAALAAVFWIWSPFERPAAMATGAEGVHVEFVEFAEGADNPMVYVDEESGFVVVWAEVDASTVGS